MIHADNDCIVALVLPMIHSEPFFWSDANEFLLLHRDQGAASHFEALRHPTMSTA